jgi:N-acetylmuramoyl-L-alanine amidase
MPSCGKHCARLLVAVALWGVCTQAVAAQTTASLRYAALSVQEQRVTESPAATADDFRAVIDRYWSFVQRSPASGFADNALWQAAHLSAESWRRFGEERDKYRAVQLLQWLSDQYPHSSLRARAVAQIEVIQVMATLAAARVAAPAAADTVIRAVHRTVLEEVVRVTLELDREVPFYQERLEGPARVFFDLKGTRTVPSLVDATFRYDSDIIRHIRLGRHPNNTTRIVLDLENVSRFSVFTLYNPYRIVIDAERASGVLPQPRAPRTLVARSFAPKPATPIARLTSIAPLAPAAIVIPNAHVAPVAPNTPVTPVARNARVAPIAPTVLRSRTVPVLAVAPVATIVRTAVVLPAAPGGRNASTRAVPTQPAPPIAPPASTSAPSSQTAMADKPTSAPSSQTATADKPTSAPSSQTAMADKPTFVPPSQAAAADKPSVISGKPIAPSANSSGKFSVARQLGLGVSRIVIDAGHGGHDPGASTPDISEAELVLDVSLRLEKLLQQQPGVEVVLTRRTNEFVSLDERTELANRESADLFLSIHANASANALAHGVETYFLNFALNPQAEAVAARENAASGKTMSSLPSIIKAITLNSKLNESRDFATSVQRSLVRGMRPGNKALRDLGVKQAPFMVLIGAAMPSVLAEISFVTNAHEARLLKTSSYRQRIAESLLAGILRYQQSLKKVQTAALQ